MNKIKITIVFALISIFIGAQEVSTGGTKIIRHKAPEEKIVGVSYLDEKEMEAIESHIEKYIGPIDNVFHEIISEIVHIDICIVKPTKDHNFYTLCTMGMSSLPMNAPKKEYQFSELFICLPPDWKMSDEDIKKEENYWPVRLLKTLARFPHEYNDWLFYGHSMPNGDPAVAYASNTKFSNVIILEPFIINDEIIGTQVNGKVIYFFPIYPLYNAEMKYKLDNDSDKLIKLFKKNKITEVVNINRKPVIR